MTRTPTSLDGRVGIVTGASTGIGRATAKALAEEGVRVGVAARTTEKLEALADEIESEGGEALVVPTDVREREQVASMVERTREAFGGLDLLVNNAGVGHWEREGIVDGDLDEWDREIEVNLQGVMYGTHMASRVMAEDGGGDVVYAVSRPDHVCIDGLQIVPSGRD
jgi:NADP-dependent 3-hydroxy acid dehydrogenase YdfG